MLFNIRQLMEGVKCYEVVRELRWRMVSKVEDPVHHLKSHYCGWSFQSTRTSVQHFLILQSATTDPFQPFLHLGF
jgi:hypothetical protein